MTESSSRETDLKFYSIERHALESGSGRLVHSHHEIQVHAFCLTASSDVHVWCDHWLSRAEHDRIERFRFERDRHHYVVAHGYLRHILGRYCGRDPGALEFRDLAGGKPTLIDEGDQVSPIRFSLSHSRGYGLLAVAHGVEVGVDLEQVREEVEHRKLAERFFSPAESNAIRAERPDQQRGAFFRHWVGKEAILKARGTGLQFPLDQCEMIFDQGQDVASVRWGHTSRAEAQWVVRFLPLPPGWVGAVAAEGTDWTVRSCRQELSTTTR
jgi:4'-phosphopantetheinyl transferase